MNNTNSVQYVPTSKGPIRYANLRPGSYFQIVAEPSRRIFRSKDVRFYKRSREGFFSEQVGTGNGCILMPEDLVQPYRINRGK